LRVAVAHPAYRRTREGALDGRRGAGSAALLRLRRGGRYSLPPLRDGAALRPGGPPVPGAERVLAAWAYEGGARTLVLELKLEGARVAATALVDAMRDAVARSGIAAEVVTWVPGRASDIRRRGFDHAEVLARGLAAAVGLPAVQLLHRAAAARDQASLSRRERRRNLVGVFRSRECDRHVLLVDDLLTTGATAGACVSALRAGGARSVEVVVACRA
jgi:predicted amidophosphoribosyltransferase